MKILSGLVCALAVATLPSEQALADRNPGRCSSANEHFDSARGDVTREMEVYAFCVANSRGRDDCSSTFRRLRDAQDDFTAAVEDHSSDCG